MNIPLLTTKLYIPSESPNLISRPYLLARLDEALNLHMHLTLVAAKAGSGKTTLVSTWAHRQDQAVSWLSLDTHDNDPRRFLSYLIAALHQSKINLTPSVQGQLEMAELPAPEILMADLINALGHCSAPVILVLDDYHLIENPWIHQAIAFLVEHRSPNLHPILITRADPPFPLARMRGQGRMVEIRDRDLRFTEKETATFLKDKAVNLPQAAIERLEQRTEGWVVGLQMATIAMQARQRREGDLVEFIESFGGTHRYILDYLMEEVLNQQSTTIQRFLIETAILERMCGPLCDAVRFGETAVKNDQAGTDNGQKLLTELEKANLFVVALDDERYWYRYHHLFADLLRRILWERHPESEIKEYYRRASRWFENEGFLEEAMVNTMAAKDYEHAASMIEKNMVSMFARSEVPVLLRWIDQLPAQIVRTRPWIDVHRATTLALTGQLDKVDTLLDDVEVRITPESSKHLGLLGHITAIRAYTANLRGDSIRALDMAVLAQSYLTDAYVTARGIAAYTLSDIYFADDDMSQTSQSLMDMLTVGEKTEQAMLTITALCELANVHKVLGQLKQAEAFYARAHQWMADHNGLNSRVRCAYEFGLADLLYIRNQLDEAHKHAKTGMDFKRRLGGFWVVGDIPLMRILQARGDVEGALHVLHEVENIVQTHHFQMTSIITFNTARVEQWLAVGDLEQAEHWATECTGDSELEHIALARLRLAQGRASEALDLLEPQRVLADQAKRIGRLIAILALEALAQNALGHHDEADTLLVQALTLAMPEAYTRVFLDMGQPMHDMLEQLTRKPEIGHIASVFAQSLLDAFRKESTHRAHYEIQMMDAHCSPDVAYLDPLTTRELEVLDLLARGLTNKKIAEILVVAPSTIKQHLKNIFSKLDVHSRTQAVTRGQELHLL